ncbi:hypothetical protein GQ43DRAFT_454478 [Delitschia confertaspora ATCC 74209]|uniref:Putative 5'-nucleotidase C-terminal domain-containing protein n=1 Tax=Delitschia confertaspora ATCC 74209 TaxID=1513339 RepID=A0A9P4JQA7_9PLEO|nr:hypothetical protein GQ43DRAFT_454478 [Delitschia confertaspora ATCC 74209]
MLGVLFTFSALLGLAVCSQPSAPSPIAAPIRELPWGQLNFLHTTDVHGWWGGHLQEPSYSADWGDYISFAHHLRERADADGSDLLLIDTGDRIEGNGIYDSSHPRGKYTYDIAKHQHIDLICSGNHELYKKSSSEGEFYHTVPNFKGNYLASNLDIYNPETGELEALAPRFKKFTTKNQGIRILAFGFVFDFTGNANNTVVRTVLDTAQTDWFQEVIRAQDIDLILVFGHVDIRSHEYSSLFAIIRNLRPDLPIQFFGGHTHIRDYTIYDDKSVALESGRYMETIGFLSITGLSVGERKRPTSNSEASNLAFSRLYIDNNLYSLHHHSRKDEDSFPTELGSHVSAQIHTARKELGLDETYGCAPHDFWVNRAPYPSNESIFTWLEKDVIPDQLREDQRIQNGKKALVITNTGAMRFDIFKGPFTKDTTFLVSPFTSGLKYIKDVPYEVASRLLKLLNNEGPIAHSIHQETRNTQAFPGPFILGPYGQPAARESVPLVEDHHKIFPGYTTQDDAGSKGDDTIHSPISYYDVPNCIQAAVGFDEEDIPETVDVVFNEFIQPWIILALKYFGQNHTGEDTAAYMGGKSFTTIITDWVKENWGLEGDSCPT